jgi:tol-pal system protein YbgF
MKRFIRMAVAAAIICSPSALKAQEQPTVRPAAPAGGESLASTVARFSALMDEFASVKGSVEASNHLINAQYQELSQRIMALDSRIQAIEDRLSIFSSQMSKALGKVAPAAAEEGDLYQKGLDLMSTSQYIEAISAFGAFLSKFPTSNFAPNAMLWIGDCHFSLRDYQKAIKEYQAFIEKYPRNEKVPEAIVKQGNSFYELGMLDDAKLFYQKVVSSYSASPAAAGARERIARIEKRQSGAQAAQPQTTFGAYPTQTLEQQMKQRQAPPADLAPEKGKAQPKALPAKRPSDF